MRILDQQDREITTPDLTKGYLVDDTIIKNSAIPIDNKTKFVWAEEDYEEIQRYIVEPLSFRVEAIKGKLAETDYVVIKIAEGSATLEEYAEVIAQREVWREEIRELEE